MKRQFLTTHPTPASRSISTSSAAKANLVVAAAAALAVIIHLLAPQLAYAQH